MSLGTKLFGGLIVTVLLIWAGAYLRGLWYRPEKWNPVALGYTTHVGRLQVDSVRFVRVIAGKDSVIANRDSVLVVKDTLIKRAVTDWQKALSYAETYKQMHQSEIAASDKNADLLSLRDQELAWYHRMEANGTLPKIVDIAKLKPQDPVVINAGLKTANREAVSTKANDSLLTVTAQYKVMTERLGSTLRQTGPRLAPISANLHVAARKARFLWFETKQSRLLKRSEDSLKAVQADVQKQSELEVFLNKK